jgi:hypothetical protein
MFSTIKKRRKPTERKSQPAKAAAAIAAAAFFSQLANKEVNNWYFADKTKLQ